MNALNTAVDQSKLNPMEILGAPSLGARHDRFVLAVDLGTSGCKCALVRLDGVVRGWAFRPVPLHIVDEIGAEQDPEDWWRAFVAATQELLRDTRAAADEIAAISCSCQGEGTIPVDRKGYPLHRAVLWMDMRGGNAIRRRAGGRRVNAAGYNPLKLLRWIRLSGGAPALSGKDPAGHMAFIQEVWPEIYDRTYKFLNVLDYMNLRLTGRFVATVDSILTSWVTDNRDANNIHYDKELVAQSGIAPEKLPDIVRCTDIIGTLDPLVADQLGLSRKTPVVAGAVDNSAAAIGSGAIRDGEAHLYIGTSAWIGAHVPFKKTDVFSQIASVPCAINGRYLLVALQTSAGYNLSFLRDRIFFSKDELNCHQQQPDVYQVFDRIAARVPAGARGLLYLPWLFGERSPVDDPSLRAGLLNLSLEHSREDIIRAFLEGVALNTRWMVAPVGRFLGKPLEQITMVGGGANSDVWCQIFADVLGIPMRQIEAPIQANVLGAAFIGGVGIGEIAYDDVPALTRIRRTYFPDPANRNLYDESFRTFKEAHRRLAPLYRRLNPLRRRSPMSFEQARRDVISTCLMLADRGYLAGTGGNVAYRIDDETFAITPSATDYYAMRPEDICVLRLADLARVAGEREPSVEHGLHAHVLRARPDCRASIHTHQPIASAYSLLGRALEISRPEDRATLGPCASAVGYAPSGTRWLASKLRKAIRPDINAYLLRNHGVLCCGLTLEQTICRVEALERCCADFFRDEIKARLGMEGAEPLLRLLVAGLVAGPCLPNVESLP